jgi:hypothetical protein
MAGKLLVSLGSIFTELVRGTAANLVTGGARQHKSTYPGENWASYLPIMPERRCQGKVQSGIFTFVPLAHHVCPVLAFRHRGQYGSAGHGLVRM